MWGLLPGGRFSRDKETRGFLATVPTNRDLFLDSNCNATPPSRALDRIPLLAKANVVPASSMPSPCPQAAP